MELCSSTEIAQTSISLRFKFQATIGNMAQFWLLSIWRHPLSAGLGNISGRQSAATHSEDSRVKMDIC